MYKNAVIRIFSPPSGTRKAKTETFVVRTKKREDVIKRAVDIGGVEMVIEEKAKKEEKVPVVQEKTMAPQVHSMTPAAKNSNKSDLSCSIHDISQFWFTTTCKKYANKCVNLRQKKQICSKEEAAVTREWLEVALKEASKAEVRMFEALI